MEELVDANLYYLDRPKVFLVDGKCDTHPAISVFSSSIGQRLRHCFDHYHHLSGASSGKIDYDHRQRESEIECLTEGALAASGRFGTTFNRSGARSDGKSTHSVKMTVVTVNAWQESTFGANCSFWWVTPSIAPSLAGLPAEGTHS